MSYLNLPNPCLSAVILTVSTHSGPQFVFNYPPVPSTIDTSLLKDIESELLSDSESDSNWSYASDEDVNEEVFDDSDGGGGGGSTNLDYTTPEPQYRGMPGSLLERLERPRGSVSRRRHHGSSASGPTSRRGSTGSNSGIRKMKRRMSKTKKSPTTTSGAGNTSPDDDINKIAGFDTDFLSELLCPQRAMCNTKFEMCVDDTVFLGLPIHIQADGQWRKKRNARKTSYSVQSTLVGKGKQKGKTGQQQPPPSDEEDNKSDSDDRKVVEDLTSSISSVVPPEFNDPRSPMRMFHVVFVMTPPITEYKFRVDQMYHFVLTNFVKTLRTEQAKSNYVWNEVSTMLKVRDTMVSNVDEGKKLPSPYELCDEMMKRSSLAVAIGQLYNAIDTSDIANVKINNKLRSFQIPIEYEFSRLPAITEPYLSRSYLTSISDFDNALSENTNNATVNAATTTTATTPNNTPFNIYSSILLLDSPDRIIKDIGVDPYSLLANFIRDINPTLTIQILAATSGVEVNQIIELMRSLIYWRKARPIAPLHHRNIYAVSPLAAIGQIYKYIPMFKEQFPSLPALPRMLSTLSTGKPRSFAYHIPSKDHRDVYLNALGWLFKYGFVMQLRTFVWLRITKKIKMAVNRDIQNEEQLKEHKRDPQNKENNTNSSNINHPAISPDDPSLGIIETKNTDTSTDNTSKRDTTTTTTTGIIITDTTSIATPTVSSTHLNQLPSTTSTTTTATPNHSPNLSPNTNTNSLLNHSKFATSSSHSSDLSDLSNYVAAEDWKQDTILLDPTSATLLQKKWIAKISENKSPDVTALFYRLVKYFNGHSAMENVMLVENLPRQDLRRLINTFDEYLIIVRHW